MMTTMNLIDPGLWLGSMGSSRDLELLTTNKITHILVVAGELPKHFPEVLQYK